MDFADKRFSRTDLLFGENTANRLAEKRVLIIGVGGVGGHAAENIVRAGAGFADFIDGDTVDISNCNRQIIALDSTVGIPKTEVLAARCRDINPDGSFTAINRFISSPEEISSSPATILKVVDLPQPEGPTNTINSLSEISRLKSYTALTLPG